MLLAALIRTNRGKGVWRRPQHGRFAVAKSDRAVPSTSNNELPQEVRCILCKTA